MASVSDVLASLNIGPTSNPSPGTTSAPGLQGIPVSEILAGLNQPSNSLETGISDKSDRFTAPEDPNDNWLQKSWHFLNQPLTESLLGWGQYREGAGGVERGVEKIASNVTSPLSLLTTAAFAPLGLGEGVAGGVLKTALTDGVKPLLGEALDATAAEAKISQYAAGLKAAQGAQLAGKDIAGAVEGSGLNYDEYKRMGKLLLDNGLKESDVLPEGGIRRFASQGLLKAGVGPQRAVKIAKSAEALTTLGFGYQAIKGATYAYPKMAQLLEEGRVNDAAEYMVEGTADTLFGALGIAGTLHSFSQMVPGFNEKNALPTTSETQNVINTVADYKDAPLGEAVSKWGQWVLDNQKQKYQLAGLAVPEALEQEGSLVGALLGHARSALDRITGAVKKDGAKLDDTNKILRIAMDSGSDRELIYQSGRALAEAMGPEYVDKFNELTKDIQLPTRTVQDIIKDQQNKYKYYQAVTDQGKKQVDYYTNQASILDGQLSRARSPERVADLQKYLEDTRNTLQKISTIHEANLKTLQDLKQWQNPSDSTLLKYHEDLLNKISTLNKPISSLGENALNEFNDTANSLGEAQRDIGILRRDKPELFQGVPGEQQKIPFPTDYRTQFPPRTDEGGTTNVHPLAPWETGPRSLRLPDDLENLVNQGKEIFGKMDAKTKDKIFGNTVTGYAKAAREIPENIQNFINKLRDADDDVWAVAHNNGLVHSYIENHLHRQWEDPLVGSTVKAQARSGAFSTNVLQARQRVRDTLLEGLLRGQDVTTWDPVETIRQNAIDVAEAAANRKVVDALRKSQLYNQRGMPLVVIPGSGPYVEGADGEPGKIFVKPDAIVNTDVPLEHIKNLQTAGLLQELLNTREIVDRTPQVNLENVDSWVQGLRKQIDDMERINPLFLDVKPGVDGNPHKAGWENLGNFVKTQSGKAASHIRNAIQQIRDNVQSGKYRTLNPIDIPTDVAQSSTLRALYSGRNIPPSWLDRYSETADKLEAMSQGESASKFWDNPQEGSIRPSEISRRLFQEREFIPPELSRYLKRVDEKLGTGVNENWSHGKAGQVIRSIEQAANSEDYPRANADLGSLRQVKNLYSDLNPISQEKMRPEAEKLLADINSRQPKEYKYNPKRGDYLPVDHPAFQNWKWMGKSPDGTSVLTRSNMLVDKTYHPYLVNRLGLKKSELRGNEGAYKITSTLLKAGGEAKSLILSGSPFHVVQEGLRALMLGVNPFYRPNAVADLSAVYDTARGQIPVMRLAARNGLNFQNSTYGDDFSEGLASKSKVVSKIPVFGPVSDEIHTFLFDRLIPSLKASGFRKMFDKYAQAHPDWTDDAVAHAAATHTNNVFGGQNWREMGRSAATQDWFHLVALAPDWLESEMRFAASVLNGAGLGAIKYNDQQGPNFSRQQVATMAIGMYMSMRILNSLYSGATLGNIDPHWEAPFALATKDKEGRTIDFGFRTLPSDIIHAATLPGDFLSGRVSPLLRTTLEGVTGRNQYGQKLTDAEKYMDMVSNMIPIPFQQGLKTATGLSTGADVSTFAQIAKASGATAQVYRSPAQLLAAQLASQSSEEGSMTPDKVAKHRVLLRMEDDLRAGRITNNDIEDLIDSGKLSEDDAKNIKKVARETTGLPPEEARMYSRVTRMALPDAFSVYDEASPREKQLLQGTIVKKAQAFIRKSRTSLSPQERQKDLTFLRARQLITQAENQTE